VGKNALYVLIGILAVVVIALTVQLSHEREEAGVTIELKDNGISVDRK
jgi:hypothetical protein